MTGRQEIFQQAMNQGHSAAWDEMWDKAALFYRQALDEIPDQPQALTSLGLALYQLQDFNGALRCYQRAATVAPSDPLPIEKVAQLYERIGKLEPATQASLVAADLYLKNKDVNRAIENWVRVTRLHPENFQAHSRLAYVYEKIGEKNKAVNELLAVASLLQTAGDIEKAARLVLQAIQMVPASEEAQQAMLLLKDSKPLPKPTRPRGGTAPLRMAQVRQLETPKELNAVEGKADPITGARQKALTVLADLLFEGSDDDEPSARRGLQSIMHNQEMAAPSADRGRVLLHLGQVVDLQTKGELAQAAVELENAIQAGLDNPAAHFDLGFLQTQGGYPDQALRHLRTAVKQPEYALGAYLLMGDILQQLNRAQEAAVAYLEALRLADASVAPPDQADDLRQLYDPLIETQRQQSDPEAQARLCQNIAELLVRPNWPEHLAKARDQLPVQDLKGPLMPLAEILLQARSGRLVESLSLIHELAHRGDLRTAMEEAFYALQEAPTYLPLHTYMGELLLKSNQLPEAITKFNVVARTYTIRGEPQRAIDLYRRILDLAPMDLTARSRLIEQLTSNGLAEQAVNEFVRLADVYYNLADLDMARKTLTEALRLAQQSKLDRTMRVQIMHRMADIDMQSLEWRQAMRLFEQIRTVQPDDEKARSSLIDLNYRLGQETLAIGELDNFITHLLENRRREKATAFLESLVAENPERVAIRRRLAEMYRQAGRTNEAIEQLDAVGDALLEAGEKAAAVKVVETILAMNPANRSEYLRLLTTLKAGASQK